MITTELILYLVYMFKKFIVYKVYLNLSIFLNNISNLFIFAKL